MNQQDQRVVQQVVDHTLDQQRRRRFLGWMIYGATVAILITVGEFRVQAEQDRSDRAIRASESRSVQAIVRSGRTIIFASCQEQQLVRIQRREDTLTSLRAINDPSIRRNFSTPLINRSRARSKARLVELAGPDRKHIDSFCRIRSRKLTAQP